MIKDVINTANEKGEKQLDYSLEEITVTDENKIREVIKEQLKKLTDVGHDADRAGGGSSKIYNLDIEDRETNRKTVNV